MSNEILKNYLSDYLVLLHEKADELRNEILSSKADDGFKKGQLFAYYELIDLFKSQAESFSLDETIIGLDKLNPDKYLL